MFRFCFDLFRFSTFEHPLNCFYRMPPQTSIVFEQEFFVKVGEKAECTFCGESISLASTSNLKKHLRTKHKDEEKVFLDLLTCLYKRVLDQSNLGKARTDKTASRRLAFNYETFQTSEKRA